jgi:hypothetical protein
MISPVTTVDESIINHIGQDAEGLRNFLERIAFGESPRPFLYHLAAGLYEGAISEQAVDEALIIHRITSKDNLGVDAMVKSARDYIQLSLKT